MSELKTRRDNSSFTRLWHSYCFRSREPSVDTITSYFGFLPISYYTIRHSTREKKTLQIHYSIKTRRVKLSLNSIIIDVTDNTLHQKRYNIVLSCYEEF